MSGKTRRKRPASTVPAGAGTQAVSSGAAVPRWEWRTFPVYFAFALGGFLGLYMGLISALASGAFQAIAFGFWAVLLGFGFSRITSRWMVSRNWGPAARRARKK